MSRNYRPPGPNRKPSIRVSPNHKPPSIHYPATMRQMRDTSKVLLLIKEGFPMPGLQTPHIGYANYWGLIEIGLAISTYSQRTSWQLTPKGEAFVEVFTQLRRGDEQRAALLLLGFNLEEDN